MFLRTQSVTIHTNLGDIKCEIFCEEVSPRCLSFRPGKLFFSDLLPQQAPKASHNFLALCASSYYDNTLFHRWVRTHTRLSRLGFCFL